MTSADERARRIVLRELRKPDCWKIGCINILPAWRKYASAWSAEIELGKGGARMLARARELREKWEDMVRTEPSKKVQNDGVYFEAQELARRGRISVANAGVALGKAGKEFENVVDDVLGRSVTWSDDGSRASIGELTKVAQRDADVDDWNSDGEVRTKFSVDCFCVWCLGVGCIDCLGTGSSEGYFSDLDRRVRGVTPEQMEIAADAWHAMANGDEVDPIVKSDPITKFMISEDNPIDSWLWHFHALDVFKSGEACNIIASIYMSEANR